MSTAKKAIEKFVERFWPEAKVDLIKENENEVIVDFYGHMCFTCGIYDYFDDFKYILEDETMLNWRIERYKKLRNGRFRVVFRKNN
jgi:thiol:disulfide interchange protein